MFFRVGARSCGSWSEFFFRARKPTQLIDLHKKESNKKKIEEFRLAKVVLTVGGKRWGCFGSLFSFWVIKSAFFGSIFSYFSKFRRGNAFPGIFGAGIGGFSIF